VTLDFSGGGAIFPFYSRLQQAPSRLTTLFPESRLSSICWYPPSLDFFPPLPPSFPYVNSPGGMLPLFFFSLIIPSSVGFPAFPAFRILIAFDADALPFSVIEEATLGDFDSLPSPSTTHGFLQFSFLKKLPLLSLASEQGSSQILHNEATLFFFPLGTKRFCLVGVRVRSESASEIIFQQFAGSNIFSPIADLLFFWSNSEPSNPSFSIFRSSSECSSRPPKYLRRTGLADPLLSRKVEKGGIVGSSVAPISFLLEMTFRSSLGTSVLTLFLISSLQICVLLFSGAQ